MAEVMGAWLEPNFVLQLLAAVFHAVLFLQSGVDKVVDKAGNLEWLRGHFKSSPLAPFVPMLVLTLTILELAAGAVCFVGALSLLSGGGPGIAYLGMVLCGITFIALFFGQRLAKDYAGAASLSPYFTGGLLGIAICSKNLI